MYSHNTDSGTVNGVVTLVKKVKFILGNELVNCRNFQTFGLQIATNYIT